MNWWEGAAKLLSAGPLGLGAIVVIVTGLILVSGKNVEAGRLKLALSMLLTGIILVLAGFGVLILQTNAAKAAHEAEIIKARAATEHMVFFRIEPLTLKTQQSFPPPIIMVNNKKLDEMAYNVTSDVTVIVDVSEAMAFSNTPSTPAKEQDALRKNREQVVSNLETTRLQVQRIAELMVNSCPGGSNGRNPANYGDVLSLVNGATSSLESTKQAVANSDL